MKIDLHCHSKHSKRPSLWLMQKLGCPECFTEPRDLYDVALRKGMTHVTITDHNVIDGALEIADLPNTTLGCEYTAYFPEDDCKVHVLAYGITEAQHRDLGEARKNIFDLVEYLQHEKIRHACAHPLYAVNERLTPEHVEKLILFFKTWEWNGELHPELNAAMQHIIDGLTPKSVERLANKHNIKPGFAEPWKKNLIGGSDDHSSLNLAFTFTEVPEAEDFDAFWQGVEQGRSAPTGKIATPQMSARNFYGIAFQFYTSKLKLERFLHQDLFLRFLFRMLQSRSEPPGSWIGWFASFLPRWTSHDEQTIAQASLPEQVRFEGSAVIRKVAELATAVSGEAAEPPDFDPLWFRFVSEVSNKVIAHQGRHLLDRVFDGYLFDIFQGIGSAGALYALLGPFFMSYSMYGTQRAFAARMRRHFTPDAAGSDASTPRVALFTDAYHEENELAALFRRHLETAQALGRELTIITCGAPPEEPAPGVATFAPVDNYKIPDCTAGQLAGPPFLDMLNFCYEQEFTHIHVGTPGPVGIAAAGIARILQLPTTAACHLAFPEFAKSLTGDTSIEDILWRFLIWFYDQLDEVYVADDALRRQFLERGSNEIRTRVLPRPVDIDLFNPSKRGGLLAENYEINDEAVTLLYAGSLAHDASLPLLIEAYKTTLNQIRNARLVVVGDGPRRDELEAALAGTPAVFTGALQGEDLAVIFASSDMLIVPGSNASAEDAVHQAQASGIPIVAACGQDLAGLIPNETALITPPDQLDPLVQAVETLIRDSARRESMGRAARNFAETHGLQHAFEPMWRIYAGTRDNAS